MIITRAPFRVSFCGGGSDIPSFYEKYGGCVISTTIDKYVYLTLIKNFDPNTIALKYSETEIVHSPKDIKHRIFRQVLTDFDVNGVEISSTADIPSGTGLGSSSSFASALLLAMYTYRNESVSKYKIAKEACNVEILELGNPIGKQDQFAASFGGLRYYEFYPDGFVKTEPIVMGSKSFAKLEQNVMLFYTGLTHDANVILADQVKNITSVEDKINGTKRLCELTKRLKNEFEDNNIDALGDVLRESWSIKKTLSKNISNPKIDEWYKKAMDAGASGGKLLGAGGGGFLMFYVQDEERRSQVRLALSDLHELPFEFDKIGCSIVLAE
jgi:D-glycero-alpha-D-manno-heptose-7-phosphate kinase